jgi:large conductance mechanosensitive channel
MLKEFKEFAMRGNVVDMAVGIIIGAAFGGIAKSLVADVMMPPIGLLLGGVDFSNIFVNLSGGDYASLAEAQKAGAATLNIGVFVNTLLNFLIVAFCVFLLVKAINALKREEASPPPAPTSKSCPHCLMEVPLQARKCGHCTSEIEAV